MRIGFVFWKLMYGPALVIDGIVQIITLSFVFTNLHIYTANKCVEYSIPETLRDSFEIYDPLDDIEIGEEDDL